MTPKYQRHIMTIFNDELRYTREERIQFAEMILKRDIRSYSELSDEDAIRILDGAYGHIYSLEILKQRQKRRGGG